MNQFLSAGDLTEFIEDASTSKLTAIIQDVWAEVLSEAPSLGTEKANQLTDGQRDLVTSILRSASVAYEVSRAGALSTIQGMAGSYSEMNVIGKKDVLTARQIRQLQDLEDSLNGATAGGAHLQQLDLFAHRNPSQGTWWPL